MAKDKPGLEKFGIDPEAMRYASIGIEFVVIFGVFVAAGVLADRKWTGSVMFTIAGAMIGFLAAMYRLWTAGKQYMKEFAPPPPMPKMPEGDEDLPGPELKGRLGAAARYKAPAGAQTPMRIMPMVAAALVVAVASVVVGLLPTYLLAGWPGVLASAVAAGLVWSILAINGAIIARVAGQNPQTVGQLFFGMGFFRMGLTLGVALGLGSALNLHMTALLIWVTVAYLTLLAVEVVFIARNVLRSSANLLKNP